MNPVVFNTTDYYASGTVIEAPDIPAATTRWLYNGKEKQITGGLDLLDYGARMYDPRTMRWRNTDPLAEKYYGMSPYVFTGNNPLRYVDPDGMDIWEFDEYGYIRNYIKNNKVDAFYMVAQKKDGAWQRTGKELVFEYGTVISHNTYTYSPDGITVGSYDVFEVRGDDQGTELFNFMSDNITSISGVEIGQAMTGVAGSNGLNFITNGHMVDTEPGLTALLNGQLLHGYTIRELNHSHPYGNEGVYPSGLRDTGGDIGFATQVTNIQLSRGYKAPTFHIYHAETQQKIPFSPTSVISDFYKYRR